MTVRIRFYLDYYCPGKMYIICGNYEEHNPHWVEMYANTQTMEKKPT